jgi:hypothetical protein
LERDERRTQFPSLFIDSVGRFTGGFETSRTNNTLAGRVEKRRVRLQRHP